MVRPTKQLLGLAALSLLAQAQPQEGEVRKLTAKVLERLTAKPVAGPRKRARMSPTLG